MKKQWPLVAFLICLSPLVQAQKANESNEVQILYDSAYSFRDSVAFVGPRLKMGNKNAFFDVTYDMPNTRFCNLMDYTWGHGHSTSGEVELLASLNKYGQLINVVEKNSTQSYIHYVTCRHEKKSRERSKYPSVEAKIVYEKSYTFNDTTVYLKPRFQLGENKASIETLNYRDGEYVENLPYSSLCKALGHRSGRGASEVSDTLTRLRVQIDEDGNMQFVYIAKSTQADHITSVTCYK